MPNRLVFCADLGGTKVAAAAVTRKGKIVARAVELVDRTSKFAAILQIKRLALRLAKPHGPAEVFAAGGVAFPGLVRRSGTVWAPNLQGWEHVPLASRLQRSLGIPFAVASDRNAAALGETWLGAARSKKDAVVLIVGTGIGAGMISGGHLVRGAHELSGCAGWLVVTDAYPNEARRIGQLETFTAGSSVPRAAAELLKQGATGALRELNSEELTGIAVAKAARAGDKVARSVFEQIGNILGRGVANIISLFDPEVGRYQFADRRDGRRGSGDGRSCADAVSQRGEIRCGHGRSVGPSGTEGPRHLFRTRHRAGRGGYRRRRRPRHFDADTDCWHQH